MAVEVVSLSAWHGWSRWLAATYTLFQQRRDQIVFHTEGNSRRLCHWYCLPQLNSSVQVFVIPRQIHCHLCEAGRRANLKTWKWNCLMLRHSRSMSLSGIRSLHTLFYRTDGRKKKSHSRTFKTVEVVRCRVGATSLDAANRLSRMDLNTQ